MIIAFIFSCLFLYAIFPVLGYAENLTKEVFFLILLPILFVKLVLKKNLGHFGLKIRISRSGFLYAFGGLLVSLLAGYVSFEVFGLGDGRAIPDYVSHNFWLFVVYELVFINIYLLIQELFFRGFVLFSLIPIFGPWAILLQSAIFFSVLIATKNFSSEVALLVFVSLVGGVVASKSRTFFYSYAMFLIFNIIFDAFIIYMYMGR